MALSLAQRLKNPGTRSKVPTSQLPTKYRNMRALNARLKSRDDPNALTAPLTPRTLDQQVKASADLYAGGAEQDLAQRTKQAQYTQTSIPAWFADYRAAQAHAEDATRNAYAAATAASQNATNTTSAVDTNQNAAMLQQMQADAATRGTQVDPSITATAQQANQSRRAAGDAQTALTAGLGAAQTAYRSGQSAVGAAQQVRAQLDQSSRIGALGAEGTALKLKKGEYATTQRQKLIDAEHTKQLENKAFGLNVQKAASDAASTTAKIKLDAEGLRLKREVASSTEALNAAKLTNDQAKIQIAQQNADTALKRANAYSTKQKTTKASQGTARKDIDYAMTQIEQLRKHVGAHKVPAKDSKGNVIPNKFVTELDKNGNPVTKGGSAPTDDQIRSALQNGEGPLRAVPPAAISAAIRLLDPLGTLYPGIIAELRQTYPGIRIKDLGYPTAGHKIKRTGANP